MAEIRTGTIAYVADSQAIPHLVNVNEPIKELRLRLSYSATMAGGNGAALEDTILRLVRRIQITKGGRVIKSIGNGAVTGAAFRLYNSVNRFIGGNLPEYTAPAATDGAKTGYATITIPFALPRLFYGERSRFRFATCLESGGEEIRVIVDWGNASTDVYSAGTVTVPTASIEVVAVTEPQIPNPRFYFKEVTQSLSPSAGANTADEMDLNRNGLCPFLMMYYLDNGARNNAQLNRLTFLQNSVGVINDQSWESGRQNIARVAGLQGTSLPDGASLILFDDNGDLKKALALENKRLWDSFRLRLDHGAFTTGTLLAHHFYILPIA